MQDNRPNKDQDGGYHDTRHGYDTRYGYGYGYGYYGDGGSPYGEGSKNLKDYLVILRERFWHIAVVFLLVFSGVLIFTFTRTEVYEATATVRILREETTTVQVDPVESSGIRGPEDLNTQIHIMRSASIIQRVADRMTEAERNAFLEPYQTGKSSDPLRAEELLMRNRNIEPQRMSMFVVVSYRHTDRAMAAKIANLFVEEYIAYNQQVRMEETLKAVEDLSVRAEEQANKLQEMKFKLHEYREDRGSVSLEGRTDIATEKLKALNLMDTETERNYSRAAVRKNLLAQYQENDRALTELGFIRSDSLVRTLLNERSSKTIGLRRLEERYRAMHPVMVEAVSTLEQTERELEAAVAEAVAQIEAEYEIAKRDHEALTAALRRQEAEIEALARMAVEYESMSRAAEVAETVYKYLLGRITETDLTVAMDPVSARGVDQAYPPMNPVLPNVPLNIALGLIGGLGMGVGLAFFVAFMDDRVKSAFDIESVVGLPLIGIIPEIKKLKSTEKAQVVSSGRDKHVVESFRSLHSSLKLNKQGKFAKAIIVTSTMPGEGKSFVSSNLALTFAANGERTVLLDCDLRMPNVHASLNLKNERGVLNYCNDKDPKPLEELVQKDFKPNLDILTTGGRAKNPTQILNSQRFEDLLNELKGRYDRVIVDSPPISAVSDALIIVQHMDGAVYTIKFNKVKRAAAKHSVHRLFEGNIPIFGAVLNSLNLSISGYYYAQYYDKSYQNYHTQAQQGGGLIETATTPAETGASKSS